MASGVVLQGMWPNLQGERFASLDDMEGGGYVFWYVGVGDLRRCGRFEASWDFEQGVVLAEQAVKALDGEVSSMGFS